MKHGPVLFALRESAAFHAIQEAGAVPILAFVWPFNWKRLRVRSATSASPSVKNLEHGRVDCPNVWTIYTNGLTVKP